MGSSIFVNFRWDIALCWSIILIYQQDFSGFGVMEEESFYCRVETQKTDNDFFYINGLFEIKVMEFLSTERIINVIIRLKRFNRSWLVLVFGKLGLEAMT